MTLYRVLRFFLAPINRMVWPTKIVNPENMDKVEGALVISNHYTKVDAIIPTRTFFKKELHVLIKEEAFQSAKIANWFLRKIGGIPIRRGTPDIDAVKAIMQVLKDNKKLLIYPEGTRNKEGTKDMAEFKEGAARFTIKAKKPIVPMIFFGSPKAFKKNYLYVGEPFEIDKFYGARTAEAYSEATQYIYDKMVETRRLCDEYVESRKHKKNKLSSQAN